MAEVRHPQPMRMLVIAFRALGDMVLISPILRALKQTGRITSLTLLVDTLGAEVFRNNPWVDRLMVLDRAAHRRLPWRTRMRAGLALIRDLCAKRFGAAVDLAARGWPGSRVRRCGVATSWAGEVGAALTWVADLPRLDGSSLTRSFIR